MVNDTVVGYSERWNESNKRKLPCLYKPASAVLNIQCALAAAAPRVPMLHRPCHSLGAGLPTQCLIKLQLRDRLCIRMRTRISHQPIVPGFRCQVCRLVKINFGNCLYHGGRQLCRPKASPTRSRRQAPAPASNRGERQRHPVHANTTVLPGRGPRGRGQTTMRRQASV